MTSSRNRMEHAVHNVTHWIGSIESMVVHTLVFIVAFGAVWVGVLNFDRMLLILTTAVSLEAIYLAIFIQFTVNQTTESLEEVEQDIGEIQEDIDELQEDVEEMSEDENAEEVRKREQRSTLEAIHAGLERLTADVARLQEHQK